MYRRKFLIFSNSTTHLLTDKISSVKEKEASLQLGILAYFTYTSASNLVKYVMIACFFGQWTEGLDPWHGAFKIRLACPSYLVYNYYINVNEAAFKYRKLSLI